MRAVVWRRCAIGALAVCLALLFGGGSVAFATTGVASLVVTQPTQTAPICSPVTIQAEADDANGNGVAGQTITFSTFAGSANTASGTAVTDANGNASFTYTGTNPGQDTFLVADQAAGLTTNAYVTWTGSGTCGGGGGGCPPGTSGTSTVSSNFNGTAIPAGDTVWFSSVMKVSGLNPSQTTTIRFTGQSISVAGSSKSVPDAVVTFSPSATTATTSFDTATNTWETTVPVSGLAGNVFLSGFELPVPGGLPGGLNPVSWTGTFVSATSGLKVNWQWAAAVYKSFNGDYNALGVKPVDDNQASVYQNSDHAGTPENYKQFVTGGARGGGGSNFTGSLSPTGSISPCPPAS